jgi:hypothetical protein
VIAPTNPTQIPTQPTARSHEEKSPRARVRFGLDDHMRTPLPFAAARAGFFLIFGCRPVHFKEGITESFQTNTCASRRAIDLDRCSNFGGSRVERATLQQTWIKAYAQHRAYPSEQLARPARNARY